MAFADWLWLVRLIIEILKLLAQLPEDELRAMANLRGVVQLPDPPGKKTPRKRKSPATPASSRTT